MREKLEDILDSDLGQSVLTGLSFAGAIMFLVFAVAAGIAAIAVSPWWLVAFGLCGLLCGLCFGLAVYLMDSCW